MEGAEGRVSESLPLRQTRNFFESPPLSSPPQAVCPFCPTWRSDGGTAASWLCGPRSSCLRSSCASTAINDYQVPLDVVKYSPPPRLLTRTLKLPVLAASEQREWRGGGAGGSRQCLISGKHRTAVLSGPCPAAHSVLCPHRSRPGPGQESDSPP